jgi:hypothetical protein
MLGFPQAILELAIDRPLGLVAVRLCDVAPDGPSLLVARGLLNLSHRNSDASPEPMEVREPTVVRVRLGLTGHAFARGHRIRLAVSAGYWPFAWPAPEPVRLELLTGGATALVLPVREGESERDGQVRFATAEQTPAPAGAVGHEAWRTVGRDLASGRMDVDVGTSDVSRLEEIGLAVGESTRSRFTIGEGDPLSARVDCEGEHHLERDDGWRVRIALRTSLTATSDAFVVTKELDAFEGDACVHSARDSVKIPRDHV